MGALGRCYRGTNFGNSVAENGGSQNLLVLSASEQWHTNNRDVTPFTTEKRKNRENDKNAIGRHSFYFNAMAHSIQHVRKNSHRRGKWHGKAFKAAWRLSLQRFSVRRYF